MILQGKKIFLRTTLPSDAGLLYNWENNKANWQVSGTKKPFTKKEIEDFISNQKDIYLDKQLRLIICISPPLSEEKGAGGVVGCIDLFEFDERSLQAGVGILIEEGYRKKGYASEALTLLINYSFKILNLRELQCTINKENIASMKLFEKHQFISSSNKKNINYLRLVNALQ